MTNLNKYKSPFKVALSVVLFYWLAFYMNWDLPIYGAYAIAFISLDTTGASLQKGLMRMAGTTSGLIFGLIILIFFLQMRWGTLIGLSIWITFNAYYMQGSKYPYAWYVSGFVPLAMWADSYPNPQTEFSFAIYRYLETSAGVIIYTIIDTLIWPKTSANKLFHLQTKLASDIHAYFKYTYDQINKDSSTIKGEDLQLSIAGGFPQVSTTFGQALTDTSNIRYDKKVWESLLLNTKSQYSRLEMIATNVDDYKSLSSDAFQAVKQSMNSLEKLLNRIDEIGQNYLNGKRIVDEVDDKELLEAIGPIDESLIQTSSREDQLILANFNLQISIFDKNSRNILKDLRILEGQNDELDVQTDEELKKRYSSSKWQPEKLYNALVAPLVFCSGYFLWIFVNPPGGQTVAELTGIVSLAIVAGKLTSRMLLTILLVFILVLVFVITPIYFFLMPSISTGYEILTLVFIYTFISSVIGIKFSFVKTVFLLALFGLVGITNVQSYSVYTIADGLFILIVIFSGPALILYILNPRSDEQNLMHQLNRFFNGCNKIIQNIDVYSAELNLAKKKVRNRYFESTISPIPNTLRALQKKVNYKRFPENSPDDVHDLINGIQNISNKLHDLELLEMRFVNHSDKFNDLFNDVLTRLQEQLSGIFTDWSHFDTDGIKHNIEELHKNINEKLDIIKMESKTISDKDETDVGIYIFLSAVKGLINSLSITQKTMLKINWSVWNEKQF